MVAENRARCYARRAEGFSFLLEQLEAEESILARGRTYLLTDRRVMWARQLSAPPRRGGWVADGVSFDQVRRWSPGRQHDDRPLIRLEHASLWRMKPIPARRFLSFEWGNDEGPVPHTETTLRFARRTDPVFVALHDLLRTTGIPEGEPFVERPRGTREERVGVASAPLYLRE